MMEDNDDAIPYCIATGDIKKLVTFFTGRGQLLEALLIAQVQRKSRQFFSSEIIDKDKAKVLKAFDTRRSTCSSSILNCFLDWTGECKEAKTGVTCSCFCCV